MSKAADLWREKIEFLEAELVTASGAQKFALQKGIEEAKAKLREMGVEPPPARGAAAATPQAAGRDEKRGEVFISYAWGDETPAGQTRAEVVDALYAALEKDGFTPVRDRDQMHPGDRISAFIERLTRADLVVAVVSDKYLRSPYCMFEIYKLWQRRQGDASEMARHLVPIVLPEVRIGNLRERAPYLRYWREQAEELAGLQGDLGLQLSPESLKEARLVQEFSHHVDGILVFLQDVLMPRKLEAHLDDGFPAVLEALRRRIGMGGPRSAPRSWGPGGTGLS